MAAHNQLPFFFQSFFTPIYFRGFQNLGELKIRHFFQEFFPKERLVLVSISKIVSSFLNHSLLSIA
ncbi:hypothetical protein HCD_01475 [Helicobacter cetorum MIT 99-5656]|uniref:Uncharacterized protein n=1 Tax=Helicobacter cetorum (strain ATCC BAA-540 / CCUG 52418 / MIT 99-5656) TaxID=1163745 RepID=I0EQV8_HELCM|nr:hypothetical protein HCD_01475 [Helicobacter cetorum MIT 99-5656]